MIICETQICVICKMTKSIVKFDQMITKKEGKIRRKTCRKCTYEGKGNTNFVRNLRANGMNRCALCEQTKSINEFYGENWCYCKECWKIRNKQWAKDNSETVKTMNLEYYGENKEDIIKYQKEYCRTHKEKINTRSVQKRKDDPQYKIKWYLRTRLYKALKRNSKVGSAVADLGMAISDFKKWLEEKFYFNSITGEIMSWDNYGKLWEIDHIKALCLFDLTDRKQFLEAVHYSNLRPLWVEDHQKKTAQDMRLFVEPK